MVNYWGRLGFKEKNNKAERYNHIMNNLFSVASVAAEGDSITDDEILSALNGSPAGVVHDTKNSKKYAVSVGNDGAVTKMEL